MPRLNISHRLLIYQLAILTLFLLLTLGNELIDIPHYIFGNAPTSFHQRMGEIGIELTIYMLVIIIEVLIINRLIKRIKILEGFIPICANCKNIREEMKWQPIEDYITKHSLAKFTHSLCPQCCRKLYPEFAEKLLSNNFHDTQESGFKKNCAMGS